MLKLMRRSASAPPVRVLVLHDCAVAADRLTAELARGGTILLSQRVNSEGGFLQAVRAFGPDLVLASATLANFNARTALHLLQTYRPGTPVILIVETLDDEIVVRCLRAGAENVVLESNLNRLGPAMQRALSVRQPLRRLSRRQLQVLRLVTEGLTSKEIAARFGLSVKTVETHRGSGMRRLGLADVTELVRYAVRVGLIPQTGSMVPDIKGASGRRVAASTHLNPLQVAED
jgi:DNA-binding NarL/FixJ family response regulator